MSGIQKSGGNLGIVNALQNIGQNLSIIANRIANGVTSVTAAAPLTGGTIVTSGTVGLAASGVTAGVYGGPIISMTVDEYGRITALTATSGP